MVLGVLGGKGGLRNRFCRRRSNEYFSRMGVFRLPMSSFLEWRLNWANGIVVSIWEDDMELELASWGPRNLNGRCEIVKSRGSSN